MVFGMGWRSHRILVLMESMTGGSMKVTGKWGYSTNEEWYTGFFDSREEAIAEARSAGEDGRLWVGQFRDPMAPEDCIDAEDLIERVLCQDDYCGDWAEGALDCTPEQERELTAAIRRVFGEWMDRHGLRPQFGVVGNAEEVKA
jgi:hypothetical protein